LAKDNDNLTEMPPTTADASCGVDTTPPSATVLLSPKDWELLDNSTPMFEWSAVQDFSGVQYSLQLDENIDFSSPMTKFTTTPICQLSPEEALNTGTYFWRIRAIDGAGNMGAWSPTFIFMYRPFIPSVLLGAITAGETATADFSAYNRFIVKVLLTVTEDITNGQIRTLEIAAKELEMLPPSVILPPGVLYKYSGIVFTTIPAENIATVTLKFRIEKSWLISENIGENDIRLFRWAGNMWEEMPVEMIDKDETAVYFQIYASGFSTGLFAAIGKKPPAPLWMIPWLPLISLLLILVGVPLGLTIGYPRFKIYLKHRMLRKLHKRVVKPPIRRIGIPIEAREKIPIEVLRKEAEMLKRLEELAEEKKREAEKSDKLGNRKLRSRQSKKT
ncbi:MAG: PGF-pre-PGF domain-containing protein, partial [Candidatus Hadarchaeales archaeon]